PLRGKDRDVVRVRTGGGNAGVPESGFVSVVIAIHLHRLVGWGAGRRCRPARAQVEAFASKNAQDVGLGSGTVDVAFGAPIVFGDADFGAGIISIRPAPDSRDELDDAVDPRGIHVVGVPEGAGGAVAQQLSAGGNIGAVVGTFISLRVKMHGEI